MAVALTALFLSLGGVSYGLATGVISGREIRNNTITFKDVKKDKLGGGSIKESALGTVPIASLTDGGTHFAVVNAGGQQVRARGTTSAARTSEGRYQVIFDRDVRGCAYYATLGGPTAAAVGVREAARQHGLPQTTVSNWLHRDAKKQPQTTASARSGCA